eukprot:74087_1
MMKVRRLMSKVMGHTSSKSLQNSSSSQKQSGSTSGKSCKTPPSSSSSEGEAVSAVEVELRSKMNKKMTVNDYQLLVVVGKGSFGKVILVKEKRTGRLYAMKILKKKDLAARNQVQHTKTERKVLAEMKHPFIVSLRYSFQTKDSLYMILDYFNGGELFFHLKRDGRFSENRARFYGAQILCALEALHKRDIVYRDLKPENILLDSDGNIMITDFGLSKHLRGVSYTHTFCGTPEYLSPEVLQRKGHGKAVDWWSFGTLLYEMMTGLPPFYHQNLNVMYDRILHATIPFPTHISPVAQDMFCKLLHRNPEKRLGSGPRDAEEIKEHPFFSGINWDDLCSKRYRPPYRPPTKDQFSTENVDKEFTSIDPRLSPTTTADSVLRGNFTDFSYSGPSVSYTT